MLGIAKAKLKEKLHVALARLATPGIQDMARNFGHARAVNIQT